ncbi:hypothetical protein [Lacinutrix jangbogonensis]|uniref:hypothetical protein n=1 Tax=Lacinutrix jangbogonensis TaxID=1469557 RepID=UPI000AE3CD37|nr:hypothetical protein [Lacinutrix jangbogonensis]
MKKSRNKGGGFLLVIVGVFFAYKFIDFNTTNDTYGMIASAIIICLGFYGLYKSKKSN